MAATELFHPGQRESRGVEGGILSSWGIQKFVACPHTSLENIWRVPPLKDCGFFLQERV